MAAPNASKTVRRSVALPRELVEEALAIAPPELRHNLNRLTITALREYAERRKAQAFAAAMAAMAADAAVAAECAAINEEFAVAEGDGLRREP